MFYAKGYGVHNVEDAKEPDERRSETVRLIHDALADRCRTARRGSYRARPPHSLTVRGRPTSPQRVANAKKKISVDEESALSSFVAFPRQLCL